MKIKYLNRWVLSILIFLVVLGIIINQEILIYAIYYFIILGSTQLVNGIILSCSDVAYKRKVKTYLWIVFFYFTTCFTIGLLEEYNMLYDPDYQRSYLTATVPLFLCIYFTYIIEKNEKLQNE